MTKTRDEMIDDLIRLFTCSHCGEITERDHGFNGRRICRRCHDRASAGNPPLLQTRGVPQARSVAVDPAEWIGQEGNTRGPESSSSSSSVDRVPPPPCSETKT
jgi:hypothetical protein